MKKLIEKLIPLDTLLETVNRFFLSVVCAIGIFFLVLFEIHDVSVFNNSDVIRAISILGCLYFWFGVAKLIKESLSLCRKKYFLVCILPAVGILALLGISDEWGSHMLFVMPALLLILMFAPYLKGGDDLSVWFFNRQVWFGAAVSYLALLLFAGGVCAAFFAIESLFHVSIPHDLYADIWAFAGFVLGPIYALSWVPKQFDFTSDDCKDPPGLKFIVNWISVPMAFVYLAILYAYFIKIILTQDVPQGILAWIISGFVGAGVVTYLVSWPLREVGSAQLRLFHKVFFPTLIIPVGFHFFAIWERIGAYGVTEQRYFLLVSAIWFMMIALGNLFRKMPIKAIPATLAILLVFASFGPWGAVNVSSLSQQSRLETLLVKNNLLKDGKVQKAKVEIPFEDRLSISSIVNYLCSTQREAIVYQYFEEKAENTKRHGRCYSYTLVEDQLGFDFVNRYSRSARDDYISISGVGSRGQVFDIRPYDYVIRHGDLKKPKPEKCGENCEESNFERLNVTFDKDRVFLVLSRGETVIYEQSIQDFIVRNRVRQNRHDPLFIEGENEEVVFRMNVHSLYGRMVDDIPNINNMTYDLYYRFKEE